MIVCKFGGTSVANVRRIQHSAAMVHDFIKQGHQVVVVVSAMGETTDQLVQHIMQATATPNPALRDVVLSAGEQIAMGLFAMALEKMGVRAQTFAGWQVPIITDNHFAQARVQSIPPDNLMRCLTQGVTPVIAGFQGVTTDQQITTLGRGGSDITAVELAIALKAQHCYICKDVEGVYSCDPSLCPAALKLSEITYDEMIEMSENGAQVLQASAARLIQKHAIPTTILSSFIKSAGTRLVADIADTCRVAGLSIKGDQISIVGKNVSAHYCLDCVAFLQVVIPAKAGIQSSKSVDSRMPQLTLRQSTPHRLTFACAPQKLSQQDIAALHERLFA